MVSLTIAMTIFSLAGWTVVDLLVFQQGPFDMFERLREKVGAYDRDGAPLEVMDAYMARNPGEDPANLPEKLAVSEMGELFSCPWCMSIWVALVFTAGMYIAIDLPVLLFAAYWFAMRGMIMLWERVIRG